MVEKEIKLKDLIKMFETNGIDEDCITIEQIDTIKYYLKELKELRHKFKDVFFNYEVLQQEHQELQSVFDETNNLLQKYITEATMLKFELTKKDAELKALEKEKVVVMLPTEKKLVDLQNEEAILQLEGLKYDIWTDQQDDGWLNESVDLYYLTDAIEQRINKLRGKNNEVY